LPIVALLLALMLPLQSFAAASSCEHAQTGQSTAPGGTTALGAATAQGAAAHEHCAHHPAHASTWQSHGCCAACCMAAVVAATLDWTPPRAVALEHYLPAPRAPLLISPDRLDRPP
jgi:hypothetical protein